MVNLLKILFLVLPLSLCAADTIAGGTEVDYFDLLPDELIEPIMQDVWDMPKGLVNLKSFSLTCKRLSVCAQRFVNNDSTIESYAIRRRLVVGCHFAACSLMLRKMSGSVRCEIPQFSREQQEYVPKICAAISLDAHVWFKKNVLEKNIKCTHSAPAFLHADGKSPVTFLHWIAGSNADKIASLAIEDCDKDGCDAKDLWAGKPVDEKGQSPFDYALNYRADKIILLLLKKHPSLLEKGKESLFKKCAEVAVLKNNKSLVRWLVNSRYG